MVVDVNTEILPLLKLDVIEGDVRQQYHVSQQESAQAYGEFFEVRK
jgi:hypothetical protein